MAEQQKSTLKQTIEDYAIYANISKKEAHEQVLSLMGFISDMLTQGKDVNLLGFGKFYVKERAGFLSRNPQTQEPVQVPPVCVPAFKFSQNVKNKVKESIKPSIG